MRDARLRLLGIVFAGALGCVRRAPPPLPPSRAPAFCRDAPTLIGHAGAEVTRCHEIVPDFFSVDLGRGTQSYGTWFVFLDGGAVLPCRADTREGFTATEIGAAALARHLRRIRAWDREGSLAFDDLQRAAWVLEALPPHFSPVSDKWVAPVPDAVPGLRFHPFAFTVPAQIYESYVDDLERWTGAPIHHDIARDGPIDIPPSKVTVRATLRGGAGEPFVWRVEILTQGDHPVYGKDPPTGATRWQLLRDLPLEGQPHP